jgi:cation-transporting P-type ATPase E
MSLSYRQEHQLRRIEARLCRTEPDLGAIFGVFGRLYTGEVMPAALLPYPFLPRHLTIIDTLAIGVPSFFLALAPNRRRYLPGFVGRVLRFTVPAGLIVAAATFSAYALARARGLPLGQQRTAATLVALILSLCVLAQLAIPLTWRRIALLIAALAGFALLFPVPAVRRFYSLELPHGEIGSTLLIAALGAATLAGFWAVSRRLGRGPAEAVPE